MKLCAWDASRGKDLAQKATENTMRYHEIFCRVVDRILSNLEPSSAMPQDSRDTIDILHDQRLQAAQESQNNNANNNQDGGGVSQPLCRGRGLGRRKPTTTKTIIITTTGSEVLQKTFRRHSCVDMSYVFSRKVGVVRCLPL